MSHDINRRAFIKVSTTLGAGLALGFEWEEVSQAAGPAGEFAPNAWLRITPDNRIIFILDKVEMGQGVMTSHPMMLAEELEVDPEKIEVQFAPAERVYANPMMGFQLTGGSTSVATSYLPLRNAGATARMMLVEAAAKMWSVKASDCIAEMGSVSHKGTGKTATYGKLASAASQLKVPKPVLKDPKDFKIIGKSRTRLDAALKVTGKAQYGIDVMVPNMLVAVVLRCPVRGGKPKSIKDDAAKAMRGVKHIVTIPSGIAVVATNYWEARQAANAVVIDWDEGEFAKVDSKEISKKYEELSQKEGKKAESHGDFEKAFPGCAKTLEAVYEVPYLAHATMEPQNCTAHVTEKTCDVWAPTQSPGASQHIASQITGLPRENVKIHQTFLGGGFGRRIEIDYVTEAVHLSKMIKAPVKIQWSREDDMANDFYRPTSLNRMKGGLDKDGNLEAWFHRAVSQSILAQSLPSFAANMTPNWFPQSVSQFAGNNAAKLFKGTVVDKIALEGALEISYAVPHFRMEWAFHETTVPIAFWRSVGHSYNAFLVEGFVDELAHLGSKNPLEFRQKLLTKAPRNKAVLDLVAEKAGWGNPLPKGVFRGIAQHSCFGSFAAQVAEVSVTDNQIKVHRIVCVIDCGMVINPDIVVSQIESGIIFGLTAALKGQITFEKGRVQQTNFHNYELLRMNEIPKIEVHILPSKEAPTGVGEPGTPPVAPAVANAIFAATGKRLRKLPLSLAAL
jgi:isoquinoline 1-oxidoreductase beta subunit